MAVPMTWSRKADATLTGAMPLPGMVTRQSALVSRLSASQPALLASSTGSEQRLRARQRQRQRRLTVEQTQQLIAEYEAGAGIKELAARWDLHRTTVAARLRRAGVQLRRQGVPDTLLNEAIQLYGEGWSCQRLAGRYGCDAETARQTLRRAGVRMRAPWDRT
jgi:DNA-directed RNA polymerase specialized sigma24 family protein